MLIFWLVAMAAEATPLEQGTAAPRPEIVVEGKSKLVCTTSKVTGSRVGRSRRCRTKEEADAEALLARQLIQQSLAVDRINEATACGPPSIRVCE